MKRAIRLIVLAAALILSWNAIVQADGSCESMHLKSCPFNGIESPCTYADGSPGLCTCVHRRWDCLL